MSGISLKDWHITKSKEIKTSVIAKLISLSWTGFLLVAASLRGGADAGNVIFMEGERDAQGGDWWKRSIAKLLDA